MYSVTRGETGSWGIEGYEVAKKYEDIYKSQKEKELKEQVKGQKSKKYITKRGHFFDDIARPFRNYKVPVQYDVAYKWAIYGGKDGKERPKSAPTKKMTYIDEIFRYNQKKDYPKPGPGAYDITKKIPDLSKAPPPKAKDIKTIAERPNFLQDFEYLSDTKPGPGSFNPRPILPKLKMNNTKPAEIIKKHKDFEKFALDRLKVYPKPEMATYKPFPMDYNVFGKSLQQQHDKTVPEAPKIKYWGQPKPKPKIEKSKSTNQFNYDMIAQWPGKEDGQSKDKKKFNWMNKLSKGVQKSIYY